MTQLKTGDVYEQRKKYQVNDIFLKKLVEKFTDMSLADYLNEIIILL